MTEERAKRKLTAILSADVKGYSRLMGEDELATVRTLEAYRGIITEAIINYRGRVVDSPGDNVLAEFVSVVDAVESAVEIQRKLKAKNAELAENRRMEFRIGINLGDVIDEGERIYGDGVNIAARVEGLAEGGGICISRTAFDQVKNKVNVGYENLGEHSVKNIAEPVRVYRVLMGPEAAGKVIGKEKLRPRQWRWAAIGGVVVLILVVGALAIWNFYLRPSFEPASLERMAYPLPNKPSIAVLPFTNLSGEKEQEYFCDGLSEGIINGLSKTDHLFVIARNSTFTYRGKPTKIKQVAEDLGVRYVLEGSIQKAGGRVRITAQLIDALSGHYLFSERYDRELKDILNLQDEITMKVLTAVQVKLTVGEGAIISAKGTKNLEAYLKVLQAREYKGGTMNKERVEKAMQLLEEAIALDPEYAYAYSILSTAYFDLVVLGASDSPGESLRRAVELGKKAVALDESNPYAHANLAFPYMYLRQFDKAISEAEKGISLAPNYAGAYFALGTVLQMVGRPKEAIPILQKCLRLSPVPVHSQVLGILAGAYNNLGQYEEAIATYKKELQIYGPDHLMAHLGLATTYAIMGRENEARAEGAEMLRIDPEFSLERFIKSLPWDQTRKDRVAGALRKAGLPDKPPLPLPDKPSIAVLPFVNMSGDPEQEYFSDGISEEIITALCRVPDLFVIARNSTFTYKGKPVKVQQVGRELGVKYVLEGSVRKAEDKVRITAQLVDARTGNHLWAERYDRDLKDVFAIQDEITMKIITELRVKLTAGEQARLASPCTENFAAYLKYLEAIGYIGRMNKEDNAIAQRLAEEAIALDPAYACAYSLLGATHLFDVVFGSTKSPKNSIARAIELAHKAIALNPSLGGPHAVLGNIYRLLGQHEKAIAEAEKAIALSPNSTLAHGAMGGALRFAGKSEESIPFIQKAIRLDPSSTSP